MVRTRFAVAGALAALVAIGSSVLPGDMARAAPGRGYAGAARAVPVGPPVAATAGARRNATRPARAAGAAAPAAAGAPAATTAPAVNAGSARALTAAPAVAFAIDAACNSSTGSWSVEWAMTVVAQALTSVSATDPVNGVAAIFPTARVLPAHRITATTRLPGSATVAALSATFTVDDGSSMVVDRTLDLGAACPAQTPEPCDGVQAPHADFTADGDRANILITGPCAQFATLLRATTQDPQNRSLIYSYGYSIQQPGVNRRVGALDLPPCQWSVGLSGGTYTGGSGFCTDASMTAVERCDHSFLLTLTNGADATMPTTFLIGTPSRAYERQVAPGQSVTMTVGPAQVVSVSRWGYMVGAAHWQQPHDARCSEVPPGTVPGGAAGAAR